MTSRGRPGTAATPGSGDFVLPGVADKRPMTTSTAMSQDLGGSRPNYDSSLMFADPHGVPHMRGVHTSQSALERDAANHWKKWGCGGRGPADMLIHLAEELKHLCWVEEDRIFADKRIERIYEQMLHISHRLIKQPPKPGDLPAIANKETLPPLSVSAEENARLRKELKEAQDMVAALEATVSNYVIFKSKVKARENFMQSYALSGRYLLHDVSSVKTCFGAWAKKVCGEANIRSVRERGSNIIKREQDMGFVAVGIALWEAQHRIIVARSADMERFKNWINGRKSELVIQPMFHNWAHEAQCTALGRALSKAEEEATSVKDKFIKEKSRLLEKFKEAALGELKKRIGADEEHAVRITLSSWMEMIAAIHQERKDEEERERKRKAAEAEAARKFAMVERLFFRHASKLRVNSWQGWWAIVEKARIAKKQLDQNMSMAMKGIMGAEAQLLKAAFCWWIDACRDDIASRQRHELAHARSLLGKARERAMSMLGKNLKGANDTILAVVCSEWKRSVDTEKALRKRKDGNIARAMKGLMAKNTEVMAKHYTPWKDMYFKRKARDQRLDQVTKSIGMNRNQYLSGVLQPWYRMVQDEKKLRREEEERKKKEAEEERLRQKRLAAAEGCFFKQAKALVKNSWTGWLEQAQLARAQKALVEQGMNRAMKMIMASNDQLKSAIVALWVESVRYDEVQRRLREQEMARQIIARAKERTMRALEGKIGQAAEALVVGSYTEWARLAKDEKFLRIRKKASMDRALDLAKHMDQQLLRDVMPEWLEIHKAQVRKAQRLEAVSRGLGASDSSLKQKALLLWRHLLDHLKTEKQEEARLKAIKENEERLIKRRCIIADRWYARVMRRMQEAMWNFWLTEVEAGKEAARRYEQNMKTATGRIMGGLNALQAEVLNIWKEDCAAEMAIRMQMKLKDAELAMKLVAQARERAIAMFEKNLYKGNEAIYRAVITGWIDQVEVATVRKMRDDIVMANVLRKITNAEWALLSYSIGAWQKDVEDLKMHDELRRQAETNIREAYVLKCQGVIGRMHKRVAITHILDAWAERAIGRK